MNDAQRSMRISEIEKLQARFVIWKKKLDFVPCLDTHKGKRRFVHAGVNREFAGYLQGVADTLPLSAPEDVKDAMISKGVRSEWVDDVYKAMRTALIKGESK